MAVMDRFIVNQRLGPSFDEFDYLPANETRGGILLAWNAAAMSIRNVVKDSFSITKEVHPKEGMAWWITVVNGPQSSDEKVQFLAELTEWRQLCPGTWMIVGDFNMILRASKKSNDNLDRTNMARF